MRSFGEGGEGNLNGRSRKEAREGVIKMKK
jgi:hypothetical protein